jgi:hypothetical protein
MDKEIEFHFTRIQRDSPAIQIGTDLYRIQKKNINGSIQYTCTDERCDVSITIFENSTCSNRTSEVSSYSSTVSINSWRQNSASKTSHPVKQLRIEKPSPVSQSPIPKTAQTTNSGINNYHKYSLFQGSSSVPHIQQPPLEPNYFPPPQNTNIPIPLEDPFVYMVSLIHHLKHQLAVRYPQCVRWLTEEKNCWLNQDGRIEHDDLLIFCYQTKNLPIHIHWNVKMLDDKDFSIDIKLKANENINLELPMGIWKINEQTTNFDLHFNSFEMKIKMLIDIICQSIAF